MKSLRSKEDSHCFVRHKYRIPFLVFLVCSLTTACSGGNQEKENTQVRSMVYEGMPAKDLENILGTPAKIDSSGSVFDANKGKTIKVQKWYYEKRVVVLIDDTVIKPTLPDIN